MSDNVVHLNQYRKAPLSDPAQIVLGPDDRVVFHGTNQSFESFDLAACGAGGDHNSHWGIHLAESASDAADYACVKTSRDGGVAQVLVVRATTRNPLGGMGYYEFFGYDDDGQNIVDPQGFVARRNELLAVGYDSIDYADGEQTIVVSLDPGQLEIVARLTPTEAHQVATRIAALPDPDDDAARFTIVRNTIADSTSGVSPAIPRAMP